MARVYSRDLRDRVIGASLSGTPARQATARFGIGVATAIVWVCRARAPGDAQLAGKANPDGRSSIFIVSSCCA